MSYHNIKFKNPPIKSPSSSSMHSCDISIKDLDEKLDKDLIALINNDFKQKEDRIFCQEAYILALRNKLIRVNKGFIRKFYVYQLKKQPDPENWIINLIDSLSYFKPDPNEADGPVFTPVFSSEELFAEPIQIAEEFAEKIFENHQERIPAIKLNISVPQIRILNQLIFGRKIIDKKRWIDFERILCQNFISKGPDETMSFDQLNRKRKEYPFEDIKQVKKLLKDMLTDLNQLEKDKEDKVNKNKKTI
jgi:SpoVK/Ycf46/Vps4 family AAA+-type ATPase